MLITCSTSDIINYQLLLSYFILLMISYIRNFDKQYADSIKGSCASQLFYSNPTLSNGFPVLIFDYRILRKT
jgi:hypothetical protein